MGIGSRRDVVGATCARLGGTALASRSSGAGAVTVMGTGTGTGTATEELCVSDRLEPDGESAPFPVADWVRSLGVVPQSPVHRG